MNRKTLDQHEAERTPKRELQRGETFSTCQITPLEIKVREFLSDLGMNYPDDLFPHIKALHEELGLPEPPMPLAVDPMRHRIEIYVNRKCVLDQEIEG